MGLWWETVKRVPKGGFRVKGDLRAWPKWNPFWRFQHKWKIFKVESGGKPYYVYFDDGVSKMLCKKVIKTKYFGARIGQRNIRFIATINPSDTVSLPISYCHKLTYGLDHIHHITVFSYNITLI